MGTSCRWSCTDAFAVDVGPVATLHQNRAGTQCQVGCVSQPWLTVCRLNAEVPSSSKFRNTPEVIVLVLLCVYYTQCPSDLVGCVACV